MANTLGRVIRRVAAGSVSTSNRFAALEALDAATAQIFLTSDTNHLGDESTYRELASVPGFLDISRPSPTSAGTATAPSDFDWFGRFNATPAPAVQCLGTHVIHRVARTATTWPSVVLRGRCNPNADLGACLVVVPGRDGNAATVTDAGLYAVATYSTPGWQDLKLSVALTDESVAYVTERPMLGAPTSGVSDASEIVSVACCTVWCAFYSTSGKAEAVALTVGLEP
jgi:hypothetical protein